MIACELTQLVGTLVVVYGWFMTPAGWRLAPMVLANALIFFLLASTVKVGTYRFLERRAARDLRYLARFEKDVTTQV